MVVTQASLSSAQAASFCSVSTFCEMLSQYPQSAFLGFAGGEFSGSLQPKPSASICSVGLRFCLGFSLGCRVAALGYGISSGFQDPDSTPDPNV